MVLGTVSCWTIQKLPTLIHELNKKMKFISMCLLSLHSLLFQIHILIIHIGICNGSKFEMFQ